MITSGDKAKPKDPTMGAIISLSPFLGLQYNVSPIIKVKDKDVRADGSLADSVPKLSHISFFGNE